MFIQPIIIGMSEFPTKRSKKAGLSDKAATKTDRLFALILLLKNKPHLSTKDIAAHFGVSRRTIFRDLETLNESGVPLTVGDHGGYEILDGYQLPPLMLSAREAATLLLGAKFALQQTDASLQTEAEQVAMKIRSVLPPNMLEYIDRLQQRTILDPYFVNALQTPPFEDATQVQWAQLSEAVARQHPVFITYHVESRNETTRRKVDALGIVFYFDHWNLIGYCHLRKDIRNFRLDQIKELYVMGETFKGYENFDLQKFLEEKGAGRQQRLTLLFTPQVYAWARKRIPARIEEELHIDGKIQVGFYFENLDYIAKWLLTFGMDVTVIEPELLKTKTKTLLLQMAEKL